jgi:hypothetical protein
MSHLNSVRRAQHRYRNVQQREGNLYILAFDEGWRRGSEPGVGGHVHIHGQRLEPDERHSGCSAGMALVRRNTKLIYQIELNFV